MKNKTDPETSSFANGIADRGWAVTRPILDDATIVALRAEVAPLAVDGRGGARNLLENARVRALAASNTVRQFASAVLGDQCFAVRALLFDKTPAANWKVVWHQDLTIPTRHRADVPGYGPWTDKAGVPHVQPPVAILEEMLAIRLHLDPCGVANGPVRVLDPPRVCARERSRSSPRSPHRVCRLRAPATTRMASAGCLRPRPQPFSRVAMNWSTLMKQPSAFLPLAMSLGALTTVLVYLAMFGVVREPDEGTAAHIWQLLMAGQVPIVAFFAIKWLPQNPRQALLILALQVCAALAALAPVYFLGL